MQIFMALLAGLIFGIGLIISGMANPAKVIGFLDLGGKWDPSLAFVMGGAICVGLIAFSAAARRSKTLLGEPLRLPQAKQIDKRLVFGGLAFGVGWGLAGYCPGPALASLVIGNSKTIIFVTAMVLGMAIFELLERYKGKS
ncbi:transporter [Herminiimonas sp. KBW02]|uniref:YeeE/YedE family protein n=1 Tax=Herminiimonas sp. KBW02 TaxID=2153363 RepID=UPI000F5AB8B7|nr:YeeE/YedE family protein [Herminiimonas sp. KBW02]RQO32863.1 transporter [Herminiimonas sp. KBW02]